MKPYPRTSLGLLLATCCLVVLSAHLARATVSYWDPEGTYTGNTTYTTYTGQTSSQTPPVPGSLEGTWEDAMWSRNSTGASGTPADQGQTTPIHFMEGDAAVFAVGAGATNRGDSTSTTTFTLTMNANHTVAGFFDGILNPNSAIVTIVGSGTMTLPSGLMAFDLLNSSDTSLAQLIITVPMTGPGTITMQHNGDLFLYSTNSFSGGTQTGYSGNNWYGLCHFNNPYAFGTGPIIISRGYSASKGAFVLEGTNPITLTNKVDWSGALSNTPYMNFVGNDAGLTFSGPWTLGSKAVNAGVGGGLITISGVISGSGSFTKFNPGNLVLTAAETYTGATTVNAGVLQFGDGVSTCTLATSGITITSPGTLVISNPGTATFGKVISGTGSLTNAGTGIQTFSAANTYSGGTTINAGSTSKLGANAGVPNGDLTLNGTLDLASFSPSVRALNGTGTVDNSVAAAYLNTLTVGNNNESSAFTGTIKNTAGIVGLTQNGTGTLALGGTCTYSGPTIIQAGGTLQYQAASAMSPATSVLAQPNTTVDFQSLSGTLASLGGSGSFNNLYNTLTLSGNAATVLTQNYQGFSCICGPLNGSGTLVKAGTHAMALRPTSNALSPWNTIYYGTLTLNAGTLSLGGAPDLLPTSYALTVPNGALFQLDATRQTVSSLNGDGRINLGGGTLLLTGGGLFSGVIQNSELPGSSTAVGPGLRGYYYTNIDFTGLAFVRDDAAVNFTDMSFWPNYSPTAKTNQVSVRWLGQVLAPVTGNYYFGTRCDDGSRLWVNGQLMLDDYTTHGASVKMGANYVTLTANTRYDLVMEFFNNTSGGAAGLYWAPPNPAGGNDPTNAIPSNFLCLPGAGTLVKSSYDTLQLTGANTYSGSTLVSGGGTLQAAANALGLGSVTVANDGSTLELDSPSSLNSGADLLLQGSWANVNLNFDGTATIHGLSIDGANYAATGTWGSPSSAALNKSSQFSGRGILNVVAGASSITLGASSTSPNYGTLMTLTATVGGAAPTPTGTVTFYDTINSASTVALGTSPLAAGVATLSVSNLQASIPHALYAVYNGDATHTTSTSSTVSVTPSPMAVTGVVVATKIYDGTTIATITSLTGELPGDLSDVKLTYTANFVDKYPATTNKTVNVTAFSISGALGGNYTAPTVPFTTTGIITNKPVWITGITATNKVYDSTTTDGPSGTAALAGIVSPDAVTVTGTPVLTFNTKAVANAKPVTVTGYTLGGANAANYVLVLTNLSANITARPVTISGVSANNKVYDGGTVASLSGTPATTPALYAGDAVSIGGTPVATFASAGASGTAKAVTVTGYTLTGGDAANYTLSQPSGLTALISQASTTAALASSANPSLLTSNVTFTATITSSTPTTNPATGSVTFYTNGTAVSPSVTLVSTSPTTSTASFSTTRLPLGSSPITFVYGGDANFLAPLSPNLVQVVQNSACSATNALLSITDNGNNTLTLLFKGTSTAQYSVVTNADLNVPIASWGTYTTTNLSDPSGNWSITVPKPTAGQLFYRSKATTACP